MLLDITSQKMIRALSYANHSVFEDDSKPFNLNIVSIRCDKPIVNKFNCLLVVFWKYEGRWNMFQSQCTTLAGLKPLRTPTNPKGCAILKEGRYSSAYSLDLHNGKYLALCQRNADVDVYRDNDQDNEYDMLSSKIESGMFGINIHRASSSLELEDVNGYSAGCTVVQNPFEFDIFLELCKKSKMFWGKKFTYTLIKESDFTNANQ